MEGLNSGRPLLGIGKSKDGKVKKYKNKTGNCSDKVCSTGCQTANSEILVDKNACGNLGSDIGKLDIRKEASELF